MTYLRQALTSLGSLRDARSRQVEALDAYTDALDLRPENVQVMRSVASLYLRLKRNDEAVEIYSQAIGSDLHQVDEFCIQIDELCI